MRQRLDDLWRAGPVITWDDTECPQIESNVLVFPILCTIILRLPETSDSDEAARQRFAISPSKLRRLCARGTAQAVEDKGVYSFFVYGIPTLALQCPRMDFSSECS